MVNLLQKTLQNVSLRAATALGPRDFLRYIGCSLVSLPAIASSQTMNVVDRMMSDRLTAINFQGQQFLIDLHEEVALSPSDQSTSFGLVRELVFRNCYLRYEAAIQGRLGTVVDLGANRGVFSLMMAGRCDRLLAVEASTGFIPVLQRNFALNGFKHAVIEQAIVGDGGLLGWQDTPSSSRRYTIDRLLDEHGIDEVDLMKVDVEGSEFAMFRSPEWLKRVKSICMEVHPEWGDVKSVLRVLEQFGFVYSVTDHMFRMIDDPTQACYIYSRRSDCVLSDVA